MSGIFSNMANIGTLTAGGLTLYHQVLQQNMLTQYLGQPPTIPKIVPVKALSNVEWLRNRVDEIRVKLT